ncbi:MAG: hypothetical protein KF847_02560 [Pirellulales bacterium]|nr:hypothetical protein [Pirellulales bacterium]
MKVKRDAVGGMLEVRKGGGCLGAIGAWFAFVGAAAGCMLILGWRAGDFSTEILLGGGILVGAFVLCGLGLATYRERFRFDAASGSLTQMRQVLFVSYWRLRRACRDFRAVELSWCSRASAKTGESLLIQVVRLLPDKGAATAEPLELGAGEPGERMRALAQEIATFCSLPLHELPKDAHWKRDT